jgi:hypothetical protein
MDLWCRGVTDVTATVLVRGKTPKNGLKKAFAKTACDLFSSGSNFARPPSRCVEASRIARIPPNPLFRVRENPSGALFRALPLPDQGPHQAPNTSPLFRVSHQPPPAPAPLRMPLPLPARCPQWEGYDGAAGLKFRDRCRTHPPH